MSTADERKPRTRSAASGRRPRSAIDPTHESECDAAGAKRVACGRVLEPAETEIVNAIDRPRFLSPRFA
ncbi:hypothetical protein WS71_05775 [Burkholderia mayonis]|uniref:Uncharacterized protein n=1 Tax=Burkholderia mayonis TaxID=1385591 RepID=A0A1B4FT82_9BURK|nr:hypothetical protein WS71_05775 [Burkholderia mayonis]KVE57602.1 hypothetical protein WS71_26050 [Burkholderia mayonis]